jgi:hypothetical protein
MKNLLISLFLLTSLAASAQYPYPLPSTRIYGSLQVDSAFRSDFAGTIFANDSINIPFLGWTSLAGAYEFDGINLNTAAYYPDGLGQALPSYVVRMANGDTVSNLMMFAGGNGVDQLFSLEATIGEGKSGYEVQVVDGQAAAQMYATNFDGSTNLSVINVDSIDVTVIADMFEFISDSASLIIGSNTTNPPTYALEFTASGTNSNFAILYDYSSVFELKGDNNLGYETSIALAAKDSTQGLSLQSGSSTIKIYTDSTEKVGATANEIYAVPTAGGDSIYSFISTGYISFPAFETLYGKGLISVGSGGALTTIDDLSSLNFSSVPAYADNTAAVAALGPGKLYYTDVLGEYILKVTH